jgi:PAS domain S-box-containing protein
MYVDDEPVLLDTCKRVLERTGLFTVVVATSGKEALGLIQERRFDVVVADYQMLDINGLELLKMIRAQFPELPFIIFTGRGREDVAVEAYEHGVDFYVQKGGDVKAQFAELSHKIVTAVDNWRVKKKLKQTEERFQNFLHDFDGIAFQLNSDGKYNLLEGTVEEITGYPVHEFFTGYVSLDSIIHPDDKGRFLKEIQHLSSEPGFRTDTLFRIIRKDGQTRWLHVILHNICTEKKDLVHIQGVLYDITYLKSAQEELVRNEAKWRSIITRAPVIISVLNKQGKFLFINKSRPPHKPSDLIGTSAWEYLAPDQKDDLENALYRAHNIKETIRFESSVHLGNTVTEWLAHQISPISWNDNQFASLVVSTIITERKWLEQNLRDSEELYRAIVTASGDGIVILDRAGKISFGSPRTYDIFNIPGELSLTGMPALDFIDPAFREVASWRMNNLLSGDLDADPFEYLLVKHDGTQFRGELVTTPLRDASGSINSLLVLIRDISSRKSPR